MQLSIAYTYDGQISKCNLKSVTIQTTGKLILEISYHHFSYIIMRNDDTIYQ